MNPPSLEEQTGHGPAAALLAKTLAADLIARCPVGEQFDANAAIDEHPELRNHRSALLELAYEEYGRCHDLGIPVQPGEFAARFPTITRSLLHQIEVHHLFADGPGTEGATEDAAWPVPGHDWLDFQLLEELGRGAYSRVYLAREKSLGDRLVVVKATSLGPREAHTLGMLQHPQIVPVHSVQRDEQLGLTALCMPFLSRVSLFDVMDALFAAPPAPTRASVMLAAVKHLNAVDGASPEAAAEPLWPRGWSHADAVLSIGTQVAQALQHAHEQGVLHGDVKPSNVLVTDSGRAVLLDFNLAIFGDESTPFIAGTLPYMAPEQLRPLVTRGTPLQKSLDERSDVFGLGVTLFELLYGQSPFGPLPVENSRELIAGRLLDRQQQGPVFPDVGSAPEDRAIRDIIARCLAFDAAQRPQTMGELAELLAAQLKPRQRVRRWLMRHRRLINSAAVLACASLVALTSWLTSREPYALREWRRADQAYVNGDYEDAVRRATNALDADPRLHGAQLLRGIAYCRQNDGFVQAYADLSHVSEVIPGGKATAALAYSIATQKGDHGDAALSYEKAFQQGCRLPSVYNDYGFCLIKLRRHEDAAKALEKAISLDPDLCAAYHLRSLAEIELKRDTQLPPETSFIAKAVEICPETAELYYDAAVLYALAARNANAENHSAVFVNQVFRILDRGLACGLTKDQLDDVLSVNSDLAADRRWESLEVRPPGASTPSTATLLVDPLDDLRLPPQAP